ncbi:MAG: efflux RND transporter periplasmic adaptor subunit [Acidobacteria bacterium]|nr:efflux RND transporter periplasmic adaptor subunit [Acidobacteriota bacterium]
MKSGRKGLAIILILIAAAVATLVWVRRSHRVVDPRISFSGNVELTETRIAFKIAGKIVELTVAEGDPVKKDQLIVRLDAEQWLRQRERARAALVSAESQLTQLRTAIEYQTETTGGQIGQRQAEVDLAEARLRDLQAGSRSQEVEQARAAVSRARAEYETAHSDWQRAQTLYQSEDISRAQYDQLRTRDESSAAALRQAEEQLAIVHEGPRKELLEAARAEVARAQAALKLAGSARLELKRRQQEMETRRADIDRARADLALVESQLRDTVAVSPVDGVVLVKAAETGEVVAAGATVVSVGDLDHPWLRGYINEQDLGRVKLGQKVQITADTYPGKVYWGRVSFIASQAEFTPKQIQTREERVKLVYRIKVELANTERELKSNMPVDAEIVVE